MYKYRFNVCVKYEIRWPWSAACMRIKMKIKQLLAGKLCE